MRTIITTPFFVLVSRSFGATDDKPISVSLERTGCLGLCPSYVLTIFGDDRVTFEGRQYVKKKGVHKKKIAPATLMPIFKKIEEIGFWQLEDSYRSKKNPDGSISMIFDLPTRYVTVKSSAKSKRIEDYFGTPPGVHELEKLIDETAGVSEWVGDPDKNRP